ncbi:serine/threonine-protein kinase Nek8 isoform X2 [Myotis lucifugus]|uniref:serine/threonine-protein kinase Nek8 isoform X2 n=1 Tax=Myotis lucifugus TaxID=59463 RepID=UPI000CCC96C5|nr:serine/threonine-protein kinase Nek8 isoform X2 [Myotis lucifugus]
MEKYERIRVVGRGAFGIVHLCLRKADQKLVIIKQIPVEQMTKEERQAAQNECQVLKLLNHPNVIEYYENFLEDKALMIAMEYAPGGTLAEFIQKRCNSLLEEETILHFFVQILLALHHVHTHLILHRDLKTQNILLDKHRMVVKIGDFGISKILSSKSKAYTVVGTPCYISPELCEGKPYNQKSDIWALGCVLYELASLKRAFEAANLPALVLKIMSGTFAPISDRYSPELRQLVLSLLSLEPAQRPPLSHIMAQPLCMRALLNLHTDLGSVRMRRAEKSLATGPPIAPGSTGSRTTSARCRGVPRGPARPAIPPPLSSVYTWGGGLSAPLRLPMLNTEVVQVATGRTQKAGVTRSGRLILWEVSQLRLDWSIWKNSLISLPFLSSTPPSQDRGIIMTFGSGSNGCLGHGSLNDISQPTIVEALLGYEMVQVACGASHVLALSTERELFAWGRGDGGRLGLGTRESYNCPQQVPMPPGQEAQRVVCGIDSSMILTVPGRVLACGSNRFNKLGLDHLSLGEEPAPHQQVEEVLSFTPLCSAPLDQETLLSVDLGTAHSAAVTASGDCYTFGSNQHGQLGTNARRVSRAPCQVQGLQGIKIAMVACGDAFTVAIGAEGEVYSWGKGARGRLGRRDEDAGLPRPVQLDETHPYTVTSVSCCHGNTLLAVRLNALRAQLALSWKPDLTLGSRVVFRDLTGKGWRWVWLHPDPAPPPAWLENASLVPSGTAAQCFGAGQGGACLEGHSSGHSSGLACALPGAGRSGGAALTPPPTLCHSSETGWGKGNWLDQTSFQMTGSSANKNISCLPA